MGWYNSREIQASLYTVLCCYAQQSVANTLAAAATNFSDISPIITEYCRRKTTERARYLSVF